MRKVLHIVRNVLPSTASFIRNQVTQHINYTPSLLYTKSIHSSFYEELQSGMPCYNIIEGRISSLLYHKFKVLSPKVNRKAIQIINELQPDIIHVHFGVDMMVFSKILRKLNFPVVVSFYGYDCTMFPKRFFGLGKLLLKRAVFFNPSVKAVFAMSPDMKDDLVKIGCPQKLIQIHYYGTDCSTFTYKREYPEKKEIVFTIISGLWPKKGHIILLEAWKNMPDKAKFQLHLNIIGSGPLKQPIAHYILKNKIENVTLIDHINYGSEEHLKLLQNSDVFVHPSRIAPDGDKEGIPGAIVEAMANGLPVISTTHAGIPYIIEDQITGLLVDEGNSKQLAVAILKMASDRKLRQKIGEKGQEYAITNLDLKEKEKELESLYDTIIKDIYAFD